MMILVDTSIWADHFGRPIPEFQLLLEREEVLGHAYVTAELALGNLADPSDTIGMLEELPQARVATYSELMILIQGERLGGAGIGFVDAHLLTACRLSKAALWTRDKRLRAQAGAMGLSWHPSG